MHMDVVEGKWNWKTPSQKNDFNLEIFILICLDILNSRSGDSESRLWGLSLQIYEIYTFEVRAPIALGTSARWRNVDCQQTWNCLVH